MKAQKFMKLVENCNQLFLFFKEKKMKMSISTQQLEECLKKELIVVSLSPFRAFTELLYFEALIICIHKS